MNTFKVEVWVNGALVEIELPHSLGVFADFSAQALNKTPFQDREFFPIDDPEDIHKFMQEITPRLAFSVENTLENSDKPLQVELIFESLEDLEPVGIMRQVEPLAQRFLLRQFLAEVLGKLDGNSRLYDFLYQVLCEPEWRDQVYTELVQELPEAEDDIDLHS
jgi:type VI secretion system protein ImpB